MSGNDFKPTGSKEDLIASELAGQNPSAADMADILEAMKEPAIANFVRKLATLKEDESEIKRASPMELEMSVVRLEADTRKRLLGLRKKKDADKKKP